MSKIFMSYSHKDEAFARRLAHVLADVGADMWIDTEDIPAGMKWSRAIQQGLKLCDVMVVIISPDSMESSNVEDEWQYYLDEGKPVIPILYRTADIHFQLRRLQYIDFYAQDFNVAYRQLHAELQRQGVNLEPVPLPPRPGGSTSRRQAPARRLWLLLAAGIILVLLTLTLIASDRLRFDTGPTEDMRGLAAATRETILTQNAVATIQLELTALAENNEAPPTFQATDSPTASPQSLPPTGSSDNPPVAAQPTPMDCALYNHTIGQIYSFPAARYATPIANDTGMSQVEPPLTIVDYVHFDNGDWMYVTPRDEPPFWLTNRARLTYCSDLEQRITPEEVTISPIITGDGAQWLYEAGFLTAGHRETWQQDGHALNDLAHDLAVPEIFTSGELPDGLSELHVRLGFSDAPGTMTAYFRVCLLPESAEPGTSCALIPNAYSVEIARGHENELCINHTTGTANGPETIELGCTTRGVPLASDSIRQNWRPALLEVSVSANRLTAKASVEGVPLTYQAGPVLADVQARDVGRIQIEVHESTGEMYFVLVSGDVPVEE